MLLHGEGIRVDKPAQKEMQDLFATLKVTSSFSSSAKDITKCGAVARVTVRRVNV